MKMKLNCQWFSLVHQHGRRFFVLEHQYGRCDVMWKRSIVANRMSLNLENSMTSLAGFQSRVDQWSCFSTEGREGGCLYENRPFFRWGAI